LCALCLLSRREEDIAHVHLPNNLGGVSPGVRGHTHDIWRASYGHGIRLCQLLRPLPRRRFHLSCPLAMLEGGDAAAGAAASPGERWWVPRPIALARQCAQEAVRHVPASPPVVDAEAPPPKPNDAQPQCKGGEDLTAMAPLMGKGGTAGRGDSGGERAPLPTQLKAL
jgi:hypothetical protein